MQATASLEEKERKETERGTGKDGAETTESAETLAPLVMRLSRYAKKERRAVGERATDGFFSYGWQRLIRQARGLAYAFSKGAPGEVCLIGGENYDTALFVLACFFSGRSFALGESAEPPRSPSVLSETSEEKGEREKEATESQQARGEPRFAFLFDAAHAPEAERRYSGDTCLPVERIRSLAEENAEQGEACWQQTVTISEDMTVRFLPMEKGDSEEVYALAPVLNALGFSAAVGLTKNDALLSVYSPRTPLGFFCGLLPALAAGATYCFCRDRRFLLREMRDFRPTVLLASPSVSKAVLTRMQTLTVLHHKPARRRQADDPTANAPKGEGATLDRKPEPEEQETEKNGCTTFGRFSECSDTMIHRLLQATVRASFGGRLQTMAVAGVFPDADDTARALLGYGVSLLSFLPLRGCAFALWRTCPSGSEAWRLAEGLTADICAVSPGGRGRILLSGAGVRHGESEGLTAVPFSLRCEFGRNLWLVTPFFGYIRSPDTLILS